MFMDELIEQYPQYPDFVIARISLTTKIPIDYVVNFLTEKIAPHSKHVEAKNEHFFMKTTEENKNIFEEFDPDQVESCRNTWNSFDEENKQVIWEWIVYFIKLAGECEV